MGSEVIPAIDHEALRHVADSLRQMAVETPDELPRHRVQRALEDFRTILRAHFTFEEQSGYLPDLAVREPSLLDLARQLAGEHVGFLSELDGLITAADHDDIAGVCQRTKLFLDELSSHEQAESGLIVSSW